MGIPLAPNSGSVEPTRVGGGGGEGRRDISGLYQHI